jgi:hypothetical protein
MPSGNNMIIEVKFALVGYEITDIHDKFIVSTKFSISNGHAWRGITGYTKKSNNADQIPEYNNCDLAPISLNEVSFRCSPERSICYSKNPGLIIKLVEDTFFELVFDRSVSFVELLENYLFKLVNMISLCSGKASYCKEIYVIADEDSRISARIYVTILEHDSKYQELISTDQCIISYKDIENNICEFIYGIIYNDLVHKSLLRTYIDATFGRNISFENRLINLSTAIETYSEKIAKNRYITKKAFKIIYEDIIKVTNAILDERLKSSIKNRVAYANNYSLRDILKKFENLCVTASKYARLREMIDIDSVVESRNYYVHGKEKRGYVYNRNKLYWSTELLKYMSFMLMMNEYGIDRDLLGDIGNKYLNKIHKM